MLHLDLQTLSIATVGNLLLTSVAMLVFWNLNRDLKGIRSYCGATFLMAAGFLALIASPAPPVPQLALLGHLLLFAGALLLLDSIRIARAFTRVPVAAVAFATVGYGAVIAYWLFANDDITARALASSPVFAFLSLCSASSLVFRVPERDRTVYWFSTGLFLLHSISLTVRAGQIFIEGPYLDALATRALDWMSLVTLNLAVTGCAFGLATIMSLRARRESEQLAFFDPLTCLPNRRLFEQRLEKAYRRAASTARSLALVYCDLDNFKEVNDDMGHVVGDEVLQRVARRLTGVINQSACLARIGGDEFLLLLEDVCSREEVFAAMDRIKQATRKEIAVGNRILVLHMSCGYALFPEDATNARDLIREADAAMYRMKRRTYSEV